MGGMRLVNIPQLSDDQWTELVERLAHHASCKLLRLYWRGILGSRGGRVPGGVESADLASAAIVDVLDGTRVWDPEAHPDLLKFLRSIVDSKVSHLVSEVENRKSRRFAPPDAEEEGSAAHGVTGREPDPADFIQDSEAAEKFRAMVLKAIEGDELAYKVFECLEAEYSKPSEMADLLGVPVSNINNAQKRLRRKVSELLKAQRKGERRE
jgi:DNA-directed RNA polymerase specialized sigma24 family protein